jgi:hypothetical protein
LLICCYYYCCRWAFSCWHWAFGHWWYNDHVLWPLDPLNESLS